MQAADLLAIRLANQQLTVTTCQQPADVVAWLGAMQAQEYAMAKWAIGLRLLAATDALVEQAFTSGAVLRTHLLRPTWHFVSPADIRWLLALTAPRVRAVSAGIFRQQKMDAPFFSRSYAVLTQALAGGQQLTRLALQAALQQAGIVAEGQRLAYLMMAAELDGLICSGARQGNQFTYALLEERVPSVPALTRDEALAALTQRYFASRGPATVHDFAYWSGLTLGDAKKGVAMLGPQVVSQQLDGTTYLLISSAAAAPPPATHRTFLMPDYDEYGMGYKDRSALFEAGPVPATPLLYNRMMILEGKIVGSWKRTLEKDQVRIDLHPRAESTAASRPTWLAAASAYADFLGKRAEVVMHE